MAAAQPWPPERMRSWQVLRASFGKLAFQQRAQQFGHGHALREGRYLDARPHRGRDVEGQARGVEVAFLDAVGVALTNPRSEEHTSELPSLMRTSYAVFC